MITVKFFGIMGICYFILAVANIKPKKSKDEPFYEFWGFESSSKRKFLKLSLHCIIWEILIDLYLNLLV